MDLKFETGYDFVLQNYYPTLPRSKNQLVELIQQNRIDGFITTPPCDADGFVPDLLHTYRVAYVAINPLNPMEGIPCVMGDDVGGGKMMTEHLIAQGHKRIAFLRGPRNIRSGEDRMNGYLSALEQHNLPMNPHWIMDSEFTFDGGLNSTKILLRQADRPSAIYAGNDEAAFGALYACQALGLRVPSDVAVAGHDDVIVSKYIFPGLTTIHQPMEELIEIAAGLLLQLLNDSVGLESTRRVPARLVVRGSTSTIY